MVEKHVEIKVENKRMVHRQEADDEETYFNVAHVHLFNCFQLAKTQHAYWLLFVSIHI